MITTRLHLFTVLPGLLVSITFFAAANIAALIAYFTHQPIAIQNGILFFALFVGSIFIRLFVIWYSYIVVVTPDAIIVQQGVLRRRRERIALSIASIRISENLPDRFINCGRLQVTAANGEYYSLGPLADFQRVRLVLGL